MEVFPDPKRVSPTQAFKWFQMNVPSGYKCKETSLTTCDNLTHYWTVTYVLDRKDDCLHVRAKLSKWLRNRAKLTTVLLKIDQANRMKCEVGFKPHECRPKNALWQYIMPCIARKDAEKSEKKEKSVNTKVDLKKHTPKDCRIVDVNGDVCNVTSDVIPKKLLFDGRNITRKVFGRSRMNRHFLSQLVENSNRPLIWIKNVAKKIQFHTAGPINKDEHSNPSGVRKTSVTTQPIPKSGRASIPCDYSNLERKYQLSKLKHNNVFVAVQKYVALKCFQRKSEPIAFRSTFNRIAAANEISAHGLPVDESLSNLFHQYCKEAGINSDDVDSEAKRIRDLANYSG